MKKFRKMIFTNFKSSLTPQDCSARLQNAFVREAPYLNTVRRQYVEFHSDRVSLHDEIREGGPSIVTMADNVITDRRLIEENWRIIYEQIQKPLRIAMSRIQKILNLI